MRASKLTQDTLKVKTMMQELDLGWMNLDLGKIMWFLEVKDRMRRIRK